MKLRLLVLTILGVGLGLIYGWFIDSRRAPTVADPLQVPDNIDYYLAGVDYRALNAAGKTRYRLRTPYLEHFIREDVSQLTTPELHLHADAAQWLLNSNEGRLVHASETFEMSIDARLRRVDAENPLILSSENLIFDASKEQLVAPGPLRILTNDLQMNAASGFFDLRNKLHQFNRVKSTYQAGTYHVPG